MAVDYRIGRVRKITRRSILLLGIGALAAACVGQKGPKKDAVEPPGNAQPEISIMVNLDVGLSPGAAVPDPEAIARVREPVLARLKPLMSEDAFKKIRTFPTLPTIALSADAELIATLLSWPEVKSIAPNPTLKRLGEPAQRIR